MPTLRTVTVLSVPWVPAGVCPKASDDTSVKSGPATLPATMNLSVPATRLSAVSRISNRFTGPDAPSGVYVPPTIGWNVAASPR